MPTYRELFEKLGAMSPEQLDNEIRVIPTGYTDREAMMLLRPDTIPQFLELSKAERDVYHYSPSEDGDWIEPGLCDFSEDEVQEMDIANDEDYKLVCKKGQIIFKIKDGISIQPLEEAKVGNLDTSILHL